MAINAVMLQAQRDSANSWVWTIYHDGGATKGEDRKPPGPDIAGWGYWAVVTRSRQWTAPPPTKAAMGDDTDTAYIQYTVTSTPNK